MHKQKALAFVARIESRIHLLPQSMRGEKKAIEATCQMMQDSDDPTFLKALAHAIRSLLRNTDYRIYNESWNAPLPEDVEQVIQDMCDQITLAFGQIDSKHPNLTLPYAYRSVEALSNRLVRDTYHHLETAYINGHWNGKPKTAGAYLNNFPTKAFRAYRPGEL